MSDYAIQIEDVSKLYHIGARKTYKTARESVMNLLQAPVRMANKLAGREKVDHTTDLWALKNVSFDVKRGEVIGIIGRNGAGKSTLLKVLSRITEPTSGRIKINGRVGSLLEVGTGFHPELTGRENIFLNGAILGMRRAEIARKFDEIVAFSEVEKFIDTPVKHYSSGMYMRLAFAVAAHLEPDILIVDEVLAVGDAHFQKKCLGKMQEVGKQGRTVLFVSHNMPAILRLCNLVVLMDRGKIKATGEAATVAREYLSSGEHSLAVRQWDDPASAPGDSVAALKTVKILGPDDQVDPTPEIDRPIRIRVEYWNHQSTLRPTVSIHVINDDGIVLFCSNDFNNHAWRDTARQRGLVTSTCTIPANTLAEGRFSVLVAVCSYNPDVIHAIEQDAVSFQVVDHTTGDGARGLYTREWPGVMRPLMHWEVTHAP